MEYQKKYLDNKANQPSKFKTKNWVAINDDLHGVCRTVSQVRFKTSMLKSSLCDYSDTYLLVSGRITITGAPSHATDTNKRTDERNKEVIFKTHTLYIECASEINNTQIDHAKDLDIVIPRYNLIEYSGSCSKTSGRLRQYYRDEPALNNDGAIENPSGNSASFKSITKKPRKNPC